jgi:hypothetical protein
LRKWHPDPLAEAPNHRAGNHQQTKEWTEFPLLMLHQSGFSRQGEENLKAWAESKGVEWVILLPTLIYGHGRDKNISEIIQFIRRFSDFSPYWVMPTVCGNLFMSRMWQKRVSRCWNLLQR